MRSFKAKAILAVIVALGIAASVACGKPQVTSPNPQAPATATISLEQKAEQFYSPMSDVPFFFKSKELQEHASGNIASLIPEGLARVYSELAARGFPSLPDSVSALTVTSVKKDYTLPQTESLEDKIQTAQRALDHMKTYLLEENLKWPEVDFVIPQTSAELDNARESKPIAETIERVAVYPVQRITEFVKLEGKVKYNKKVLPFVISADTTGKFGEFDKKMTFVLTPEGLRWTFRYGAVMWSVGAPHQGLLETVPLEMLHTALAPATMKHENLAFRSISTPDEAQAIAEHYMQLEEYVAHAVGREWFRKLNEDWKLGYNIGLLRQDPNVSDWWRDENVDRVHSLVRAKSPAYVIGLYFISPEQLVSEAGIITRQN